MPGEWVEGKGRQTKLATHKVEGGNIRKQTWVILGFCFQQEKEGNLIEGAIEIEL